jgi:hypothetical protein
MRNPIRILLVWLSADVDRSKLTSVSPTALAFMLYSGYSRPCIRASRSLRLSRCTTRSLPSSCQLKPEAVPCPLVLRLDCATLASRVARLLVGWCVQSDCWSLDCLVLAAIPLSSSTLCFGGMAFSTGVLGSVWESQPVKGVGGTGESVAGSATASPLSAATLDASALFSFAFRRSMRS